jgi:hypothetical protein
MKTNSGRSIFGTASKTDRAMRTQFVASSLAGGEVGRFQDPARPYLHPEDVNIALDIDRYDFAARVEFENGRPVARMERPA